MLLFLFPATVTVAVAVVSVLFNTSSSQSAWFCNMTLKTYSRNMYILLAERTLNMNGMAAVVPKFSNAQQYKHKNINSLLGLTE